MNLWQVNVLKGQEFKIYLSISFIFFTVEIVLLLLLCHLSGADNVEIWATSCPVSRYAFEIIFACKYYKQRFHSHQRLLLKRRLCREPKRCNEHIWLITRSNDTTINCLCQGIRPKRFQVMPWKRSLLPTGCIHSGILITSLYVCLAVDVATDSSTSQGSPIADTHQHL